MTSVREHPFKVVSVGFGARLIVDLFDRIEELSNFRFTHLLVTPRDAQALEARTRGGRAQYIGPVPGERMPAPDPALLASLEQAGVPTIHNMIMGDRIVLHLGYREALGYATLLARKLRDAYECLAPSLIVGGRDSLHGGIGLAVAKQLGIPWVAMHFTPLPKGVSCFCHGMTPDTQIITRDPDPQALRDLAERTLASFEARSLAVPAYSSANSLRMVLQRLPRHLGALGAMLRDRAAGRYNRYTDYTLRQVCAQYARKRVNLVLQPRSWLLSRPPSEPFAFFGFHMQPESSIDVWAPFYANQTMVVETIVRSLPPSHRLLVKLHRSDADAFSRSQLKRLRRLPGVDLVSPLAPSREFVERASLVFVIQGTMGLEAALLGRPVLLFGESKLAELPSVRRVGSHTDLPRLVREALAAPRPDRESIVRGLMRFLAAFSPGCYNNWEIRPSDDEIGNFVSQFRALGTQIESGRFPS